MGGLHARLVQGLLDLDPDLLLGAIARILPGLAIDDVVGVHGVQCIPCADVQAHTGGDHHQHRGGQDADVGQAHGVLLHPVEHAGNSDEVLGLVVIVLPLLHGLQEGNGAGGEEAVGTDDHQDHRQEKEHQGFQGRLGGDGNVIPCTQGDHPQDGQ